MELCEIEKDNVTENAMFQIREAVGPSLKFFKIGVLKNSANSTEKILSWSHFLRKLQG